MNRPIAFAYAQARLQARRGQLPPPELWRHLQTSTSLAHFLQAARATPLRPWLLDIGHYSDSHAIERALRRLFRQQVAEVAAWQPAPWRPAAAWCARLADLPALAHLMAGETAPPWMLEEPALRPFTSEVAAMRAQAFAASDCAGLWRAHQAGEPVGAAWRERWRVLWPADAPATFTAPLERLAAAVAEHHTVLLGPAPHSETAQRTLEEWLRYRFRRHAHQPAAAFTYLALLALHLQWLRGALVRRLLFAGEGAAA